MEEAPPPTITGAVSPLVTLNYAGETMQYGVGVPVGDPGNRATQAYVSGAVAPYGHAVTDAMGNPVQVVSILDPSITASFGFAAGPPGADGGVYGGNAANPTDTTTTVFTAPVSVEDLVAHTEKVREGKSQTRGFIDLLGQLIICGAGAIFPPLWCLSAFFSQSSNPVAKWIARSALLVMIVVIAATIVSTVLGVSGSVLSLLVTIVTGIIAALAAVLFAFLSVVAGPPCCCLLLIVVMVVYGAVQVILVYTGLM